MMESLTLDDLDRRLVHALQLDGRAAFSRLADVLDVSDQTAARRYHRLRGHGILRVVGIVNPHRSGNGRWIVRLQCVPSAAQDIAAALARRPDTSWVHLVSGGTEVVCLIHARTSDESEELLLDKLPRTGRVVAITAHAVLHTFYGGSGGFRGLEVLTPAEVAQLTPTDLPEPPGQDDIQPLETGDQLLLNVLARDGRAGHTELAATTGWSQSTVRRRLEHLRRTGVLLYDLDVNTRYLGFRAQAQLWMSVPPADLAAAGQALAGHAEVAYAGATTGPANLIATVVCRDARALYRYLTERVGALKTISHIETTPYIRTIKRAGAVLPGLAT